jgi:hypothetical protein
MMIPLYNVVQLHVVDVCVGGCVCVFTQQLHSLQYIIE